jgi:hypothetical protein
MINQILAADPTGESDLAHATITLNKVLDEIMLAPKGPSMWRAVVDVLHKTNPIAGEDSKGQPVSFRAVNQDCIATNLAMREAYGVDKFGRSSDNKKSIYRGHLSMPRIVHTVIEQVDPEAFKGDKNASKMFRCFPEYRAASNH